MNAHRFLLCSVATALTGGLAVAGHGQPLTFSSAPAAKAAAQISARYGIEIELGPLARSQVSFTIDDADAPGARLQAVNALANAAGADFTKTYVIRSATDGLTRPAQVDTEVSLPSQQTTYPAREAVEMVAGTDDATVQTMDSIGGTVTLSRSTLTIAQAAAEIARQTHTRWETVYSLAPRIAGRLTGGAVIGRTESGSPIIQLAYVYYHDARWSARQQRLAEDERRQEIADQQAAAQQAQAAQQAAAAQAQNVALRTAAGYPPSSGGYFPNGPFGDFNQSAFPGYGGAYNPANGTIIIGVQGGGNTPAAISGNGD